MLVYPEHSRSQQKETVFLFQKPKPTFPVNMMSRSSSVSQLALPHPRRASPLHVTLSASFVMVFFLPLPCAQTTKASRCWGQPLGVPLAPSSWILLFGAALWCHGLAPRCSHSSHAKSDYIYSSNLAQTKSVIYTTWLEPGLQLICAENVWWQSLKSSSITL